MNQCAYCLEYKVEDHSELRPSANKLLQFPNGQKLTFRSVCYDCNHLRYDWQAKIDAEKIQLAEQRREWHREIAERNAKRRAEIEARNADREAARQAREELKAERAIVLVETQRELAALKMAKLETQIALCTRSLETLRKKYFQNDDKNT